MEIKLRIIFEMIIIVPVSPINNIFGYVNYIMVKIVAKKSKDKNS